MDRQPVLDQLGLHGAGTRDQHRRIARLESGESRRPTGPLIVDGEHERHALGRDEGSLLGVEKMSMNHIGGKGTRDLADSHRAVVGVGTKKTWGCQLFKVSGSLWHNRYGTVYKLFNNKLILIKGRQLF